MREENRELNSLFNTPPVRVGRTDEKPSLWSVSAKFREVLNGETTELCKRGIGMIKSKSGWGIVKELIDFELNN